MRKPATPIVLSEAEQATLRSWLRAGTSEQRMVERARIVLAAADGIGTNEIARQLLTRPARVSKWRTRFARDRLVGLVDAPRPGAAARYDESTERRILAALDQTPPGGHATWTGTLLAATLGDVSSDQVWRTLRRHGISLRRRRSWCLSTDPAFAAKAADIVGLYLDPRTRSSCASTRSPGSGPSSARRAGSACPMVGRSPALPTSTAGTARRRCSPHWKSRAGSSRPVTTRGAGGASSSTS
jgi:transposase